MSDNPLYIENFPHFAPGWSRIFNFVAEKAEGSYIYTDTGRKLLDFTCGIGVTNTGHAHPKVVKAIQEQAPLLLHAQVNIIISKPLLKLVGEHRKIVPPEIDTFFYTNSGAEAIENAVKIAKVATGRSNVIVFSHSFHGRTNATMALTTSKTIYRAGFGPLMGGVYVTPFPYPRHLKMSEEEASKYALTELESTLQCMSAPKDTAAILIESVLGEGGYVPPPAGFLKGLREICDRHKIVLIFDEVQSGFGRTGKWFAFEHYSVVPDLVAVAKGIASGLPLAGVFGRREVMNKVDPGSIGGTYGGNVVACAAAVATIEAMREDRMLENAEERGAQLQAGLRRLQAEFPQLVEVRGLGLMIASEFDLGDHAKTKVALKAVVASCYEQGLLLLTCGSWDTVVRWIPPLNVTAEQIDTALTIFGTALKKVL